MPIVAAVLLLLGCAGPLTTMLPAPPATMHLTVTASLAPAASPTLAATANATARRASAAITATPTPHTEAPGTTPAARLSPWPSPVATMSTVAPATVSPTHRPGSTPVLFGPTPSVTATLLPTASSTPAVTAGPAASPTPADSGLLLLAADLGVGANTLAFSPDDGRLVSGSHAGLVVVWDTLTWQQMWTGRHSEWLQKVAFSADGQRVGSVSGDGTARLWDAAGGDLVAEVDYDYWVYGLDFSAEGRRWASGSFDGRAVVADANTGQRLAEVTHQMMVADLALSPSGPWMAVMTSGSWGPVRLVVWDVLTHEQRTLADLQVLPGHSNVVFSPDTQWLAAALYCGAPVTIWQTLTWPVAAELETPGGCPRKLAFSADGRRLAAIQSGQAVDEHLAIVWDVPAWQQVAQMTLEDVAWDLALSPDGQWLAVGLGQGGAGEPVHEGQMWDTATGTLAARMPHDSQVLAVAISQDGRWIATGSQGSVKVWELR